MFMRRDLIHESFIIKRFFTTPCGPEIVEHILRRDPGFGAEIHHGVRLGFENVIALILGIVHAKLLLNVFGKRMNLKAQILAANSVEEIKTDREFRAKARVNFFAQQGAGTGQHQILRGDLDPHVAKTQ